MTVITMSRNELRRLRVLIGVGRRQIYRLLDACRVYGADGLRCVRGATRVAQLACVIL
jgi:hypothetical protein